MDAPHLKSTILFLVVTLSWPDTVLGQASAYQERIDVEWVLVPTLVRHASSMGGKRNPTGFVRGLEKRDFEITVDGRPVDIASFDAGADAPFGLIHLQDLSGSMALGGKLFTSRRALRCFLDHSRPGDELAIASFAGGKLRVEVPFTGDTEALADAMAAWRGYGTTAIHDAVAWLPEVAVRDSGMRRAAVLITDGADNASALSPAAARELVRQAKLPVYVLGLGTGSPFELDPEGQKLHRYADVLNLLAHLSGGRYFSVKRDASAVCGAIVEELRAQYVLGFITGGSASARYRTLQVTVPNKRVEVIHRQGYSGRPPTPPRP